MGLNILEYGQWKFSERRLVHCEPITLGMSHLWKPHASERKWISLRENIQEIIHGCLSSNLGVPGAIFTSSNSVIHEPTWVASGDVEISAETSNQLDYPLNNLGKS